MTPQELKTILAEYPLTVLYFSTPTCSVCRVLRPRVETFIQDQPLWHFQYVNTEESREIAGQHLIFAVPTILLVAEGREIERLSRHFGMHELEEPIRRHTELLKRAEP